VQYKHVAILPLLSRISRRPLSELLKKVKAHADKKLGDVKVENALGGMRYAV
jgi:hypothetical protein